MPRIVVATGLGANHITLRAGLELGERLRTTVDLVTVAPPARLVTVWHLEQDLDHIETNLARATAGLAAAYRTPSLPTRVTVLRGPVVATMVRYVEGAPTRLIVVGAGARRRWWDWAPSTTQSLAEAVTCPVFLAR